MEGVWGFLWGVRSKSTMQCMHVHTICMKCKDHTVNQKQGLPMKSKGVCGCGKIEKSEIKCHNKQGF